MTKTGKDVHPLMLKVKKYIDKKRTYKIDLTQNDVISKNQNFQLFIFRKD
jgi:hypothetical protein